MSIRYENHGKRRNCRSSNGDDGEDKTNKDDSKRSHHHYHHRHDCTIDAGSMDRYRGRDRDLSFLECQYQDRRRRRRRPHSATRRRIENSFDNYDHDEDARHHNDEDSRRHDRKNGRRRLQGLRPRRSRKHLRQRSPSTSSSSSSQDSHYHNNRKSNNWKRRRSYRMSRRSRSRSHTSTEQEYDRKACRDKEHDIRLNYNQHHHRNPLNDGAERYITGVVSDDDDGHQHTEQQQHQSDHSKKFVTPVAISSRRNPPLQLTANHQETILTTMGSQNLEQRQNHNNVSHHNRHNGSKSSTKNSSSKKQRKTSPPPLNIYDDTIGHFKGRDGCVIADRYRILKEVGLGTFGRVVECLDIKRRRERHSWYDDHHFRRENDVYRRHQHDLHHSKRERERHHDNTNNIVAIKIVRNVKRYHDSAKIEADIIKEVNRRGRRGMTHCAAMYDTFSFDGHYCMVFECLGPSLYDFLKGQKYHPFPIQCVRDFARQLLETLEFLHSFRLIHTDLKPENILLLNGRQVPQRGGYSIPESTRIKVIDFGGATYDNEKKSSIVNTRQYRAPEVILGVSWSMPSDLWSIGCILVELYQGELLFATHDNVEHLALIEQIIGPFPRKMLKRSKNVELVDEAFHSNGLHRMDRVLPSDKLSYVKRITPLESIITYDEDAWFLRLLRRILIINPDERATAQECLRKF